MSKLFVSLLLMFLCLPVSSKTVAVVGNKSISLDDFRGKFREMQSQSVNPVSAQTFLKDYIHYHLGVLQAKKEGLQNAKIYRERMDQELYKLFLEKKLQKRIAKIRVSKRELRRYYNKNPEVSTSHILVALSPAPTARQISAARERATMILKKVLKNPKSFKRIARTYSDDKATKDRGGRLGFHSKTSLIAPYYDAVRTLKPGQVYDGIVRSAFGYHVVKLNTKNAYARANKTQLRMAIFNEKRKVIFDKFFERLQKSYNVKMYPSVLKSL